MRYKVVRAVVGLFLLLLVGRSVARFVLFDLSNGAQVVATLSTIRAPISGHVRGQTRPTGTLLKPDDVAIALQANAVREEHLHDIELLLSMALADIESYQALRPGLEDLRTRLRKQSAIYDKHRVSQLLAEVSLAEATVKAALARESEADARLKRVSALAADHLSTAVEMDLAKRDQTVASEEARAAQAAKTAASSTLEAARSSGVIVSTSGADRAYSAQRLDELFLRATELERAHAANNARADTLRRQVASEQEQAVRRKSALLSVAARARVWQSFVSPAEYVSEGTPLLSVIDCTTPFVVASVSEGVYNRLHIGQTAVFRGAKTGSAVDGVVTQLFGVMIPAQLDFGVAPSLSSAFGTTVLQTKQGLVLIKLPQWDALGGDCEVGQTGEVLFRAFPFSGWLWRWIPWM